MRTLKLENHTLQYLDRGEGPALLFVHGFPLTHKAWMPQLGAFGGFRKVAPDLRGFGASEPLGELTTMGEYADDLAALVDSLKISRVILVGHSMGGYVALNFATRFADKVAGLILVSTKAGPDSEEAVKKRHESAARALSDGEGPLLTDMAAKMVAKGSTDTKLVTEIETLMRPAQARGIANALKGMAARPDSFPRLRQITAPTLIITGDADVLISADESRSMAAKISGAELEIMAGAGHLVSFERPHEFNAILTRWLSRFL